MGFDFCCYFLTAKKLDNQHWQRQEKPKKRFQPPADEDPVPYTMLLVPHMTYGLDNYIFTSALWTYHDMTSSLLRLHIASCYNLRTNPVLSIISHTTFFKQVSSNSLKHFRQNSAIAYHVNLHYFTISNICQVLPECPSSEE